VKPTIVVAGGTGLVGQALVPALQAAGYEVILLSRESGPGRAQWDGRTVGDWIRDVDGSFAVINLAGESIAQKWSIPAMEAIRDSRTESTLVIGESIARCANPPKFWVNASAIGIYGNRGEEELKEDSELGPKGNFLADVCREWEAAARSTCRAESKLRIARLGVVLSHDGGMLPILTQIAKNFLGGQAGKGQQWVSWIHIADLVKMILWSLEEDRPTLFNATAPKPVRNADLMFAVRHSVKRPWSPPAPEFLIKIGGVFGGPDPTLILDSARVIPAAAQAAGFEFEFEEIDKALL